MPARKSSGCSVLVAIGLRVILVTDLLPPACFVGPRIVVANGLGNAMSRGILVAAVALCVTFASTKVEAHSIRSANSFLLGCRAYVQGSNSDTALACRNYAIGALDGIYFQGSIDRQAPFCLPDEVTADQMIDVIVTYMGEHSEETNEPFVTIIYKAIRQGWPCKK
jgi:Rap1a immunity proteins